MIKDLLKDIVRSLLSVYHQTKLVQFYKKRGVEIHKPFYPFDSNCLIITPPVYIGPGSWLILRGKLYIDSGTIIGPRLRVHTSNHNWRGDMLPYDDIYVVKDVRIAKNVWIEADVSIMPGVNIGEGAVVAACSCIIKDVPPLALVGGNPAKVIGYRINKNMRN